MEKVVIELWGLTLYEPETFVSDIYLTIVCFLFWKEIKVTSSSVYANNYANFFLFLAFGTIVGGIAHLFAFYISHNYFHVLAWSLSAFGLYSIQRASAYDFPIKTKKILNSIFIIQFVLSILTYASYQLFGEFVDDVSKVGVPGFMAVSISSGIALVGFVVPLHLIKYFRDRDNGSGIIILGVFLSAGAAVVHAKSWSLNQYINYNVIAHIILSICYYIYMLGIKIKVSRGDDEINGNY